MGLRPIEPPYYKYEGLLKAIKLNPILTLYGISNN